MKARIIINSSEEERNKRRHVGNFVNLEINFPLFIYISNFSK